MINTRIATIAAAATLLGGTIGAGLTAFAVSRDDDRPDAVVELAAVPQACDEMSPLYGMFAVQTHIATGDEDPLTALSVCDNYQRGGDVLATLGTLAPDAAPTSDQCESLRDGLEPGAWALAPATASVLSRLGCANTEFRGPQ